MQKGNLSLARDAPYVARAEFETALTHYPDHPSAIVGLSNILLDIYTEVLLPPPAVTGLRPSSGNISASATTNSLATTLVDMPIRKGKEKEPDNSSVFPSAPLGLVKSKPKKQDATSNGGSTSPSSFAQESQLPPPYKAKSLPLVDRLAARDRAYGLLSGLTKLGSGWNYSEAWFALARAHEESGQLDKAKEVLWWCVELEEGMGVREWRCAGAGGYVL